MDSGGAGLLSIVRDLDMDWREGSGRRVVHAGQAVGEMVEESLSDGVVDSFHAAHESVDLVGAFGETRAELGHHGWIGCELLLLLLQLQVLKVFHSHLQNVSFLQLGVASIL